MWCTPNILKSLAVKESRSGSFGDDSKREILADALRRGADCRGVALPHVLAHLLVRLGVHDAAYGRPEAVHHEGVEVLALVAVVHVAGGAPDHAARHAEGARQRQAAAQVVLQQGGRGS